MEWNAGKTCCVPAERYILGEILDIRVLMPTGSSGAMPHAATQRSVLEPWAVMALTLLLVHLNARAVLSDAFQLDLALS